MSKSLEQVKTEAMRDIVSRVLVEVEMEFMVLILQDLRFSKRLCEDMKSLHEQATLTTLRRIMEGR